MTEIFKGISDAELESDSVLREAAKKKTLENLERYIKGEKISKWEMETLLTCPDIPSSKWVDEVRESAEGGCLTGEELDRAEKKLALVESALANAKLDPEKNTGDDYGILTQKFEYAKKLLEESGRSERSS